MLMDQTQGEKNRVLRTDCDKSKAGEGTRTPDQLITNQLLYQLSYTGLERFVEAEDDCRIDEEAAQERPLPSIWRSISYRLWPVGTTRFLEFLGCGN